uniref:Uncharacterized protein n=1 Tax=Strongyloides venezuelensis TaxID=75913 RepID=A0A0K0FRE6_STRVS
MWYFSEFSSIYILFTSTPSIGVTKLHINSRYEGPSEAVWKIMEYPILYKDWTVVRLAVYLINEECTVADEINNGNNNCFKAEKGYKSTLLAYYGLNIRLFRMKCSFFYKNFKRL